MTEAGEAWALLLGPAQLRVLRSPFAGCRIGDFGGRSARFPLIRFRPSQGD
jgi:hypothetical protein